MPTSFTDVSIDTSVPVIDGWITSSDGVEIYNRTWKAVSSTPIATVVFIHGFGEHVKRYNHVFDKFGKANIEVYAYDQRGFGETAVKNKKPGMTGGWKVSMADITEALKSQRREGVPQFLMGHSMGGGLTLNYALRGSERYKIAGYICTSPLLRLSRQSKKSEIVLSILPAISTVLPNVTMAADVNAKYISRDPAEIKKYTEDPLIHGIASLRTLGDMISGGKLIVEKEYKDINVPIYIAHGSADPVTDPEASKLLINKIQSKNKTFCTWEGRYHEMHNDYGNTEVIQSLVQWILKQVNIEN